MIFGKWKHRRTQQDKDTSSPEQQAPKRTITPGRWNRLYFGFDGFDATKPPNKDAPKKRKNIVITPSDMDMIDYCHFKIIADKKQEIHVLKKTNKSLMRDHHCKDQEMDAMKIKIRSLRKENDKKDKQLARQLAEAEYREKEWAIEKRLLMEQLDRLRGVTPIQQEEEYPFNGDSERIVTPGHQGDRRRALVRQSTSSVRALIQEKEAEIQKYSESSETSSVRSESYCA